MASGIVTCVLKGYSAVVQGSNWKMSSAEIELASSHHTVESTQHPNAKPNPPPASSIPFPDLLAFSHSNSSVLAPSTSTAPQAASSMPPSPDASQAVSIQQHVVRASSDHIHWQSPHIHWQSPGKSSQERSMRSSIHAEEAVQPTNALAHPLAHVRYKAPVQSIKSLVGLRQHIAHYLHLYNTGFFICCFGLNPIAAPNLKI